MIAGASVPETFDSPRSAPEGITDASLRRAIERLTTETGLTFPRSRHSNLRRALSTAASEASVAGVESFLDELDRQPSLLDRLISLVTIGETYFFRHPEQLDVLSRRILPSVIEGKRSAPDATIRAWSAGCSTGEEAYSLAMLIDEAVHSRQGLDFRVFATDIDRDALRRARSASYGRWSFRAALDDRAQWFEEEGTLLRVRSSIADRVNFGADNLSLEGAGPPRGSGGSLDLVVCRNVTMYLSDDARRRVAARFLRALAPGGWLVVAPVELSRSVYAAFETVVLDGLTFYRRPLPGAHEEPPAQPSRRPTLAPARHRRRPTPARSSARVVPSRMITARRLADQGLLGEARREIDLAVHEDPRDRSRYLLLASVADAQDDLTAAAAALRRAVYLDRADATAQFRLGLLEWRMGRKRGARARFATAVGLVADRADDEALDDTADLTVGRVRETARLLADG